MCSSDLLPGLAGAVVDHQPAAAGAHAEPYGSEEVLTPQHSVHRRKHLLGRLDSETCAALAAARGENRSTGAGAHALAKAVHLSAVAVVRLEGPLTHGCTPGRMIGTVRHEGRETVARTGCPMDRDVTPCERLHYNTVLFSAGSNDPAAPSVRVPTRRRHPPAPTGRRPNGATPPPLSPGGDDPVDRHTCGQPCGKTP